jgi:S1-C subfamily serine protease
VVKLKTSRTKPSIPEIETGTLHSCIGINGFSLDDEIASDMGLEKETRGVLVIGVLENSIAEKAGLRAGTTPAIFRGTKGMLGGDIIVSVEDKTINKIEELMEYISQYHTPGTRIRLRVIRNREPVEVALIY